MDRDKKRGLAPLGGDILTQPRIETNQLWTFCHG